jgi:hypothetical protein
MITENKILPSEATHWYDKAGNPVYEVPKAKGDGMRPTTIADARKIDLVPSVTSIIGIAAKPGLQKWKLQQMLHAALTLPRIDGETDDAFAERVILDSEEQSKKAMERGTELHAVIQKTIQTGFVHPVWPDHTFKVIEALKQIGVNVFNGKAEHSFASPLGYGGKLDWHNDEVLLDFKTKDKIVDGKQLAWPEHCWQLAAYAKGLNSERSYKFMMKPPIDRLINVFIGVEDCQVRIHEWSPEDAAKGWEVFSHLLSVWKITKNFGL